MNSTQVGTSFATTLKVKNIRLSDGIIWRTKIVATERRWQKAQEYERKHWEKVACQIVSSTQEDLDWYRWKAEQLSENFLSRIKDLKLEDEKILEVGSGPIGMVTFLKFGERYTVDPLEDFFKANPILCKWRAQEVKYTQGKGEALPFEDRFFSLVIIDNVLDHVKSPQQVLAEIHRVVTEGGYIYINTNVHTRWGVGIRSLMEIFQIDKGHPFSFTKGGLRKYLEQRGFGIYQEQKESYKEAKKKELRSKSIRKKIKAILGITEFQYGALCKRLSIKSVSR